MAFKTCPYCDTVWRDFDDFLGDSDLAITQYHANPDTPENGIVVFHHVTDDCGGSIGLRVKKIADVYDVTRFPESKFRTKACENHCPDYEDISACSQDCALRWVRDTLQLVKSRHPSPGPTPMNY